MTYQIQFLNSEKNRERTIFGNSLKIATALRVTRVIRTARSPSSFSAAAGKAAAAREGLHAAVAADNAGLEWG
jgi:hypothetical protein